MKVVILGGGIAGCSAAYLLKNKGITDITIVEKSKLGGCCRTKFCEGIPYEFGPQVLYTSIVNIQDIFERFIVNTPPGTSDGKYHPIVSTNASLDPNSLYSFPVCISDVVRYPNPNRIIEELYKVNLNDPDYSNFENYVISKVGPTLYNLFYKNYNIKMWKMQPNEMDTEWSRFRDAFTLKYKSCMFGDRWQGHPGNHNPLFDGFTNDIKVVNGRCKILNNNQVTVDGSLIDADLVISTLPLSNKLGFISVMIVYVLIRSEEFVMPSYTTTFPNAYNFTRIMEYKQQFYVDSEYSLLSFEFPFKYKVEYKENVEEAIYFVSKVLRKNILDKWAYAKTHLYPISTINNLKLVDKRLSELSNTNIFPLGRMGSYAYVSKDTCIRMSMILSENLEIALSDDSKNKLKLFYRMREVLA